MSLERKLKTALDETRLLILGAQVLFGFQFNGPFQELFEQLPPFSQQLQCVALMLIMTTIGLLIAPAMQHRIAESGKDSMRLLRLTTIFAAVALFPLSLGLSIDLFVTIERIYGLTTGALTGAAFFLLSLICGYALEFLFRKRMRPMTKSETTKSPPLSTQVDQLLTEARVIIPGAQALLGFQFTVTLMRPFEELPAGAKLAHVAALCCVALAVILLMAPAALHRLSFGGEDAPEFLTIGSAFVIAAPIPLAFGIALDTYVATRRVLESDQGALALAGITVLVLFALWYAFPLWRRAKAPP
jgi:hypothetical protein